MTTLCDRAADHCWGSEATGKYDASTKGIWKRSESVQLVNMYKLYSITLLFAAVGVAMHHDHRGRQS